MASVGSATTLSVKVSSDFARRYRAFCDKHLLQVGKFTEQALHDVMEDHYLGAKAQRVLSRASGRVSEHQAYFKQVK